MSTLVVHAHKDGALVIERAGVSHDPGANVTRIVRWLAEHFQPVTLLDIADRLQALPEVRTVLCEIEEEDAKYAAR